MRHLGWPFWPTFCLDSVGSFDSPKKTGKSPEPSDTGMLCPFTTWILESLLVKTKHHVAQILAASAITLLTATHAEAATPIDAALIGEFQLNVPQTAPAGPISPNGAISASRRARESTSQSSPTSQAFTPASPAGNVRWVAKTPPLIILRAIATFSSTT
jgi:hypothetical protein